MPYIINGSDLVVGDVQGTQVIEVEDSAGDLCEFVGGEVQVAEGWVTVEGVVLGGAEGC